jgi:hypothetical protein
MYLKATTANLDVVKLFVKDKITLEPPINASTSLYFSEIYNEYASWNAGNFQLSKCLVGRILKRIYPRRVCRNGTGIFYKGFALKK